MDGDFSRSLFSRLGASNCLRSSILPFVRMDLFRKRDLYRKKLKKQDRGDKIKCDESNERKTSRGDIVTRNTKLIHDEVSSVRGTSWIACIAKRTIEEIVIEF